MNQCQNGVGVKQVDHTTQAKFEMKKTQLEEKSQFQASAIVQGKHKLAPVHQELMDWITKQFGARALDFYCETRSTSKGRPQQLVHVILETVEDAKKMQAHRADNEAIAERFLKYFKSAHSPNTIADPLKSTDLFPDSYRDETNPFPEIIVTYRPWTQLNSEVVEKMLEDEKRAILKTFESVWKISMTVVFYYTDAQVKENLTNGTSAKITEELKQADEKYGFKVGYPNRFDSKETFDRDYESNWYYYWK
jgi:hypothetical protein